MNLRKGFWMRMVPVLAIVVATVIASFSVYNIMVKMETETCWDRLRIATESTAQKISVRVNDNLNFLDAVADSYVLTNRLDLEQEVGEYLDSVMSSTIFEMIYVVLPDGRLLMQNGEIVERDNSFSYDYVAGKGTHISPRITDPFLNKEVIYCFTPIEKNGQTTALLCGVINCEILSDIFEVFTFKGDAQLYLIDLETGDYIMDNWHDTLGNIKDNRWRTGLDGKPVDIVSSIMNGETDRVSFYSKTNGVPSYQYNVSVPGFNWGVCVVVQENVVFANLHQLQELLYTVAVVEVVLILGYLIWNVVMSVSAVKNEAKAHKLELTRATNEAKARFISNMSHDIRTPLNGIVGMLHIIKTHRDDQPLVDDCLNKIDISTQYLSTLTSDMLDINEIESDKLVIDNQPIDLVSLTDALSVMIEPKAVGRNVSYSMDISGLHHPHVIGSAVHIERVMVNLITNAIKYSKSEGGRVIVKLEDDDSSEKQGSYRFIVEDNGIGISEEFQKNMYNPFAQEKVTARSSYQGYGLGLTIVYRLVEKMNGTIELDSRQGEGSTFIVTLPLERDSKASDESIAEETAADLSGVRVLLVEDNDFNMEIAEVILTDVGAKVTTASNGRIATEIFAASEPNSFDIILMDIMMPELDGCEATRIIREMNRKDAKSIPIFAMTANTFAEEIVRCREAGMNEHLAKPLEIKKLMQKVAKYCIQPDKV